MKQFCTGRIRPLARPKLRFGNYLTGNLPTPPDTIDYTAPAMTALNNVYLNDQLGDCVIAGYYHVKGIETGNAGDLFIATDTQIKNDYTTICGPDDQGCDEMSTLDYWVKTGDQGGTKLAGYLGVDATDKLKLMQAIWLFENLYFGVELPSKWINPMPQQSNFVWDVAGPPDPSAGHCICAGGYTSQGVIISTWGMLGICTWAALAKYMVPNAGGETYVICTPDQLNKAQQKAPNGYNWSDLINDFDELGGNLPAPTPTPVPNPTPQPPPAPYPVPPPAPMFKPHYGLI